jgi:predicted aspartyl protease
MGYVKIRATVGSPDRKRLKEVEFLADSGSWFMVLQPSIVKELGLTPVATRNVILADGRRFDAPLVVVYLKAFDSETVNLSVVADSPEPLFGISTMEDLGIEIDPTKGEAKKVRAAGLML